MEKIIKISLIVIILVIFFSSIRLCGQAVTPAENIFTGKCKNFSTTCITPLIYKRSEKCRTFFEIDTYFSHLQRLDEGSEWYEYSKKRVEEICSDLNPEYQTELFQKYNVNSCSEIITSSN